MTRKELAQQIGSHVLECFDEYSKDPKGIKLVVPAGIPRDLYSKEWEFIYPKFGSRWLLNIEVKGPPIIEIREGPLNYKIISMNEYFKKMEQLGW